MINSLDNRKGQFHAVQCMFVRKIKLTEKTEVFREKWQKFRC